jgi:hypothetical protein
MNRLHGVVNSALTIETGDIRIDDAGVMIDPPAVTMFDQLIAWIEAK